MNIEAATDFVSKLKKAARVPADFQDRLGRCFELSARCVMSEVPGGELMTLHHGTIYNPMFSSNGPLFHGWVELPNGVIYDPVADWTMPPDFHHAYFHATKLASYSQDQARLEMLRHEHYGPWDDALYDQSNLKVDPLMH